ncbi:MAG: hypothetical protein AAF297_00090 [Planctomycetota bacterium]
MAQREPGAHRAAMSLSLMLIPGIGQVLAGLDAVSSLRNQRLVVLTDRRLLLLFADRRASAADGRAVAERYGVGEIAIEDKDAAARWWVADDGGQAHNAGEELTPRQAHRKRSRKRKGPRKPAGVARLKLSAVGGEPWVMRIAVRTTDAASRLVEGLRLLAGEAHAAAPGGDVDMLGSGSTENDFTANQEPR